MFLQYIQSRYIRKLIGGKKQLAFNQALSLCNAAVTNNIQVNNFYLRFYCFFCLDPRLIALDLIFVFLGP